MWSLSDIQDRNSPCRDPLWWPHFDYPLCILQGTLHDDDEYTNKTYKANLCALLEKQRSQLCGEWPTDVVQIKKTESLVRRGDYLLKRLKTVCSHFNWLHSFCLSGVRYCCSRCGECCVWPVVSGNRWLGAIWEITRTMMDMTATIMGKTVHGYSFCCTDHNN